MTNGESRAPASDVSDPGPEAPREAEQPTVRLGGSPLPQTPMDSTTAFAPPPAPEPAPAIEEDSATIPGDDAVTVPPTETSNDGPRLPPPAAPLPPPVRDADLETVVIEADVIPRRLRRPIDLLRLLSAFALAAVILAISYFASAAAAGLESDLTKASDRIPSIIVVAANLIGLLGVLALPIAAAFD